MNLQKSKWDANLAGQKFSFLTAVERCYDTTRLGKQWKCRCLCGGETIAHASELITGRRKSCGCRKSQAGENSKLWSGYEKISGKYWGSCIRNAKSRGLEFSISIEYAWSVFVSQSGLCSLSGVPLFFGSSKNANSSTASLDRIDSGVGYVFGNIRWVHKDINSMLSDLGDKAFLFWVKKIYEHNGLNSK